MTATHLRNQAYEQLQRQILSGALPPGSQVSELSLAKQMGLSRTPVREAVRRLVHEGLLEQRPRAGTVVRTFGAQDIIELYELRQALECFAVEQAAARISTDDLDALGRLCEQIRRQVDELKKSKKRAVDAAGLKRLLAADLAFHMILVRAAGNRRILDMVADSRVLTRIFSTPRQEHNLDVLRDTYRFHSDIHHALERRDGQAARQLLAEHIQLSLRQTLAHHEEAQGLRDFGASLPAELRSELDRVEKEIARPRPPARKARA
ncbi:MAG: GntR family transcriptional regulator [Gemmataceae bacterium]